MKTLKSKQKIRLIVDDVSIYTTVGQVSGTKFEKLLAAMNAALVSEPDTRGIGTRIDGSNMQLDLVSK